jgi:altronate hydrolase
MILTGYLRPDGKKGIRNLVAVIYTVQCSEFVARKIGEGFEDVHVLGYKNCHANAVALKVLKNIARHPNIYGLVVCSLGCEGTNGEVIVKEAESAGKPAHLISIQKTGGTLKTIDAGRKLVKSLIERRDEATRVEMSISDLRVATNCGGSDATSGLTANPAVGEVFDRIIEAGGTCFFDEITEMFGCREMAAERATTPDTAQRIRETIDRAVALAVRTGHFSIVSGNADGGLTTIEEKSLGAYMKSGHCPITDIIKVGESPEKNGLYLIDSIPDEPWRGNSPINDSENISNAVGAGAHMLLFTTGRGSPVGGAVIPVIKICGNPRTSQMMKDDIDIDTSSILDGEETIQDVGKRILDYILMVASGKRTCSELLGHQEINIHSTYQSGGACD